MEDFNDWRDYRIHVLESLKELNDEQKILKEFFINHDKKDREVFAKIHNEISNTNKTITNHIVDEQSDLSVIKEEIIKMKTKMDYNSKVVGFIAGSIPGFFYFLYEVIFKKS